MSATRILGALFVAIFAFELVSLEVLRGAGGRVASGAPDLGLITLGMAWIFGVWIALVVFMVFIIAWIGEGTQFDVNAARAPQTGPSHETTVTSDLRRAS